MLELANKGFITATDLADYLVKYHGRSFRKAYQTTATIVNYAEKNKIKLNQLSLKELQKINKYGVVLNTSFNIHGKTIVMTPQDALDDFFACGIDALYIENFKVIKR